MTIEELRKACENPFVYLVLTRKSVPKGITTRLYGRTGPRGTLVKVTPALGGGYVCVAIFQSADILKHLDYQEAKEKAE